MTHPLALWVVPVGEVGGVARHTLDVTRAGIPGWRTVVLCPDGPLAERLRAAGVPVVTEPIGPEAGLRASVTTLRRLVARLRPSLVHAHLSYADLVAALATPRSTALVSTEHGIAADSGLYHSGSVRMRATIAAHTALLHRLDALIAVSRSTADVIRQRWAPPPGLAIEVVHNGVDLPDPPTEATVGLRIGSLSRLAPEKNLALLLHSFALLRAQHPDATLRIAGTGPSEGQLRGLRDRLDLADCVRFDGVVDPTDWLPQVDVVAQLSAWENHSYSLLDAVAHGRGVVATDVGGNREIVGPPCLVAPEPAMVADRLREQGRTLAARPAPGPQWSEVADMCAGIASVYGAVVAR